MTENLRVKCQKCDAYYDVEPHESFDKLCPYCAPKWVFVSAPLRAKTYAAVKKNIEVARDAARALVMEGYLPLVPHDMWGHYTGILDDEVALNACERMIEQCDAVYAPEKISVGVRREMDHAAKNKVPVFRTMAKLLEHFED